MNEQQFSYKFAVVLYPADTRNNRWFSDIICNDGPSALNAARPYTDACQQARTALGKMLDSIVSTDQVEVWTLHVTPDVAEQLSAQDKSTLFDTIDTLPFKTAASVQHEIVIL